MQFHANYSQRAIAENYTVTDAGYVIFDALWILALALNNTMTMVNSGDITETDCEIFKFPGNLTSFETFNHKNRKMGCIIRWNLNKTNFTGVTVSTCTYTVTINYVNIYYSLIMPTLNIII